MFLTCFQALKAATAELEETRRGVRAELQGSQAAERRRFFGLGENLRFFCGGEEKKQVGNSKRTFIYGIYVYIYMYIFVFTEVFFCSVLEF